MLQILQLLRGEVGTLTWTLIFLPFYHTHCPHNLLRDHVSLERPRQGQLSRKGPRGQDLWLCWGVRLRSKPSWSHRPDQRRTGLGLCPHDPDLGQTGLLVGDPLTSCLSRRIAHSLPPGPDSSLAWACSVAFTHLYTSAQVLAPSARHNFPGNAFLFVCVAKKQKAKKPILV